MTVFKFEIPMETAQVDGKKYWKMARIVLAVVWCILAGNYDIIYVLPTYVYISLCSSYTQKS